LLLQTIVAMRLKEKPESQLAPYKDDVSPLLAAWTEFADEAGVVESRKTIEAFLDGISGDADDDDFDFDAAMDQQLSLQESIFEAGGACSEMNGKWEVEDNGDMDSFLEAIGWGWAKRKAAGLATAVTSSTYEVSKTQF
jgi:hypothetical protein